MNINEIQALEEKIDQLLLGRTGDDLSPATFSKEIKPLAEKLQKLSDCLAEQQQFAAQLAVGNHNIDPPARTNFLCGSLKELQSQFLSLAWNIEQLIQGQMVAKLYFQGQLFANYNQLIDKIAKSLYAKESDAEWSDSITSWRYHQVISAINQLPTMVIEVDTAGKIIYSNPAATKVLNGITSLPYGQKELMDPLLVHLCTFADFQEFFDNTRNAWYQIKSCQVRFADGALGLLHTVYDISVWKQQEIQLRYTANIDPLTSALTRKAGLADLEEILTLHKNGFLAFFDINNLKEINDQYGHIEGDWTIRNIAQVLIDCSQPTDKIIRYGGDEFIAIYPDYQEEQLLSLFEQMQQKVEQINLNSLKPYKLSFSTGYTSLTGDNISMKELIDIADHNMYEHKKADKLKQNPDEPNNPAEIFNK